MELTKEMTTIMKGYGIMFIALHNFLHLGSFTGYVKENENTFDVQRTWDYLVVLKSFEWEDVGQFFSFMGWIGVSVFLFISGFGLVKKYDLNKSELEVGKYVYHSWKKLAFLLIPGALYFIFYSLVNSTWSTVIPKSVLQLTLLNNFFMPMITFSPGVYWYFGLTFELYLLYLLLRGWSVKRLIVGGGCIVVLQIVVVMVYGPTSAPWSFVRHNFLGWGHVFITGMIVAKTRAERYLPSNMFSLLLLAALSLVMLLPLLLNVWTWLLIVPFVAFLFFVFLAGVLAGNKILKAIGLWLGRYSAFIFVVHPIVRSIILNINTRVAVDLWQMTILYVLFFLIGAIIYKPFYNWLIRVSVSR